ncbi:sugar MFS transporter [Thalassotalea fusca]
MATSSVSIEPQDNSNNANQEKSQKFALISLTSLFFMWGFITCLNDILIPYLKGAFDLSYTQAMLVQFCFFSAYFIVSLPAGGLVGKIGYKRGIVVGLSIASVGCLMFYPAAQIKVYALFLLALFVLASGITLLQVAANPYVSVLGPSKTASSRLTMTQAFNSLGTTIAPFFGAWLIFGHHAEQASAGADAVKLPYLILASLLILLAVVFAKLRLPELGHTTNRNGSTSLQAIKTAWQTKHLRLGAIGIFLYVGAEVAIGSFLVSFIGLPAIAGMQEAQASQLVGYYWGGAMIGRFIGAVVMRYIPAGRVLAFNAIVAILLIILAVTSSGWLAMWAILAVGLFNSIMFPTIFSLAINELGEATSNGAGILCLAIVGGAFVPLAQGILADQVGVQLAFILPALCYFYIAFYGLSGSKVQVRGK